VAVALASAAFASPQASPPPPTAETRLEVADELDAYLWKHVLKPRFPTCVDKEHGGFHVNYARDWSPIEDRSRFIVYEARVVWTAATVSRLRPDTRAEYLPYVRHGVRYLADVMWDREHGGFHTLVDLSGRALTGEFAGRPVYGQAFAIYGLAAAHAATRDAEPLELAKRAYRWVESHYRDDLGPGYRSAVKPDGQLFLVLKAEAGTRDRSRPRPPPHDERPHLLEAYAELLRSWPDPELRQRTEELLAFVRDRIFVEPGCLYIALRPDGRVVPAPVSFGHDVETAFLMIEAEEALGREPSAATLRAARMLVDQALAHGYEPTRGQLFESGSAYGRPLDRSIEWWGQFEAFHAFQLMDELFGREDDRYRTAFGKAWALARDAFADPKHPGVCPRMDERGEVHCESKSHMWFVSYHTARSLLFTADRLRKP
jgi:mannobiose 2-epimerase